MQLSTASYVLYVRVATGIVLVCSGKHSIRCVYSEYIQHELLSTHMIILYIKSHKWMDVYITLIMEY